MLHVRLPTASYGRKAERQLFLVEVEVQKDYYVRVIYCVTLRTRWSICLF